MKKLTTDQNILLVHLYNRLSWLLCNPDLDYKYNVKATSTIEEITKSLDDYYEEVRKQEQPKSNKILKKTLDD